MKPHKTTFKRLVSNLPYNPSLINQVSFYSKRLKQENSIRRLGFMFIGLTFLIQLFAVVAPATPSLAQDVNNDMIRGGFTSQGQAVANCLDSGKDYGTVLAYYDISCDNVASASTQTIRSTDFGGQLYSMGRLPYGKPGEYTVNINGRDYFMRLLHGWDSGGYSSYKALVGTSKAGTRFMILYACGNLVVIGRPPPPPPTPVKTASCDLLNSNQAAGAVLKKGATVVVRGQFTGAYLPAGQVMTMGYDYIDLDTGKQAVTPVLHPGVTFRNGIATDANTVNFVLNTPGRYQFRLAGTWDGGNLMSGSFQGGCLRNISVERPPVDVCTDIPGIQTDITQCKPCKSGSQAKDCLVLSKTVSNDTQNNPNADGTEAQAGDILTYSLFTKNTGKATVKKFIVKENISDVLDYADIVNLHGGSSSTDNTIRWPAVDIAAGATVTNKITVRVKNPIPQTPVSASNPGKFDLTMTNVYGNATNVRVPGSVVKVTEQVSTSLPNTGPGSNLVIAFGLTSFVGFFFFRGRLLNKELSLVRQEYTTGA